MKNMIEGPPILSNMIALPEYVAKKTPVKHAGAKNYHSDPEN